MKLVQCLNCFDIFNLHLAVMRQCTCGEVKGRYVDNSHAEVSGNHRAIAIGNGSYRNAFHAAPDETSDWRYDGRLEKVSALFKQINEIVPTMFMGWTRMPDGPTNSHSKIKE